MMTGDDCSYTAMTRTILSTETFSSDLIRANFPGDSALAAGSLHQSGAGKSTLPNSLNKQPIDCVDRALTLPIECPPTLVVVIDTEEEFNWAQEFDTRSRSTTNIQFQPLAQSVFDRHGVIPTYVIDYPVADTASAVSVLRTIAESGRCQIGAHLHPWVNPPYEETVNSLNSYPGNLPPRLETEKLRLLTERIDEAFESRPTIYKAGRYGIGNSTFDALAGLGFETDVSVVPHTDFSDQLGPDFTRFPTGPFRTSQGIAALPLSVHFVGILASVGPGLFPCLSTPLAKQARLPGIAARLGLLERLRLSPEGHTLADMKRQTMAAIDRGERYFMLTYHSSALLPGATEYVRSDADRIAFLRRLEGYLIFFKNICGGRTTTIGELTQSLESI